MYRRPVVAPHWDISEADWIDHPPNHRFAIYDAGTGSTADDAVFDKETGLVWERSPATNRNAWDGAVVYAYAKVVARRKGWRLPTIEELLSLVDPTRNNPTLPLGHPFVNVQIDDFYWSCTLGMTALPTFAWGYQFGNGSTSNCLKTANFYVWLVRGNSGHDYPF
jgi:hypothetical protein